MPSVFWPVDLFIIEQRLRELKRDPLLAEKRHLSVYYIEQPENSSITVYTSDYECTIIAFDINEDFEKNLESFKIGHDELFKVAIRLLGMPFTIGSMVGSITLQSTPSVQ